MLSLITCTKHTKQNPPNLTQTTSFYAKNYQHSDTIGAHWPAAWAARESLESWNPGRHQRVGQDFQPRLTAATTSVPRGEGSLLRAHHRGRRGSALPGESPQSRNPNPISQVIFYISFLTGRRDNIHGQNSEHNTLFLCSKGKIWIWIQIPIYIMSF